MVSLEKEWGLEGGLVRTIFQPCARVLAAYLDGVAPLRRVLDVGCGSGIAGRTVASRYSSVTRVEGLDWEDAAVRVATEQTKGDSRFQFRRADARGFEVDEPYDAVIAQHLLHQLGDGAAAALGCMHAALRPVGRLVVGQWPELAQCPAYGFIYEASGEYAEKAADPVMTRARLEALIGRVEGMRIVAAVLRTDFLTPPLAPRELLKQYFDGSQRWREQDGATRRARLEFPGLDNLAAAHCRGSSGAGVTFGLGMLVVVAERTMS